MKPLYLQPSQNFSLDTMQFFTHMRDDVVLSKDHFIITKITISAAVTIINIPLAVVGLIEGAIRVPFSFLVEVFSDSDNFKNNTRPIIALAGIATIISLPFGVTAIIQCLFITTISFLIISINKICNTSLGTKIYNKYFSHTFIDTMKCIYIALQNLLFSWNIKEPILSCINTVLKNKLLSSPLEPIAIDEQLEEACYTAFENMHKKPKKIENQREILVSLEKMLLLSNNDLKELLIKVLNRIDHEEIEEKVKRFTYEEIRLFLEFARNLMKIHLAKSKNIGNLEQKFLWKSLSLTNWVILPLISMNFVLGKELSSVKDLFFILRSKNPEALLRNTKLSPRIKDPIDHLLHLITITTEQEIDKFSKIIKIFQRSLPKERTQRT